MGCVYFNRVYPLTKVGTGMSISDMQMWPELLETWNEKEAEGFYEINGFKPDLIFKPKTILEISFDSFSPSLLYRVGKMKGELTQGLTLRFPVFKCVRRDKDLESATTGDQIVEMYLENENN